MPANELAALALDIEANGQREAGVLLEGMVLDGWHRYLACQKAGTRFKAEKFDGADPVAFVISRNLHRRHLTAMQKAAAVVAANAWRHRGSATVADPSAEELAERADVSVRTIAHAKTAQELGLAEQAREGKVSARDVQRVSKLPPGKRAKAVKDIKAGKDPALPKPKAVIAGRDVEKLYEQAKADLAETKEALTEMTVLAECAKAFEGNEQFNEMKILRLELKSCKRRRDELMGENAELKKEVGRWKKKAGK
jgi:hypothetical protein